MAQELFATPIENKVFHNIVQSLYPAPADDAGKATITKYESKIDIINGLYFDSPTQDGIRGTAWGAYNALTERVDYYRQGRKVKGADGDGTRNQMASASGFDAPIIVGLMLVSMIRFAASTRSRRVWVFMLVMGFLNGLFIGHHLLTQIASERSAIQSQSCPSRLSL